MVQPRINIDPKAWSDPFWTMLAIIIIGYPVRDPSPLVMEDTRAQFISLRSTAPCSKCRYNWEPMMRKHPINDVVLSSRENLSRWFCDRFRDVNKKRRHLSNDDIMGYFADKIKGPSSLLSTDNLLIVIGLLALGFMLYMKFRK